MILKPNEVGPAIDRAAVEGVRTVHEFFDPTEVIAEMANPEAFGSRTGQFSTEIDGDVKSRLYELLRDRTLELVTSLEEAADAAGYPDWQANYLMMRVTDQGYRKHPDAKAARHFGFFAYLLGDTCLVEHTDEGKEIQHWARAGDLTIMRQGLDYDDTVTRVVHSAGATGLRAFLMVGYEADTPSVYDIATHKPL